MASWQRHLGALAAAAGLMASATMCVREFDTTRPEPAGRGTVGEEVFRVVCERVDVGESPDDIDFSRARPVCTGTQPPGGAPEGVGPKVRALGARRPALVAALDRVVPRPLYDSLDALLIRLLPLYGPDNGVRADGGTIRLPDGGRAPWEDLLPQTTHTLGSMLFRLADNRDATAALGRISRRQGYRPPAMTIGLTRNLLGYPQLGEVIDATMELVREGGPDRSAGPAHEHWNTLLDALRGELADARPTDDARAGTTLEAALDLVLRADPALSGGRPRLLVRRDARGLAQVNGRAGALPAPFADSNGDGLADASSEGFFLDASGRPIDPPSPFPSPDAPAGTRDAAGRALDASGEPLYRYVDLDASVLGAVLRDARSLVDPAEHTALRLVHGASALLGARAPATRDYMLQAPCPTVSEPRRTCRLPPVSYQGFDTAGAAPLVDVAHALGTALTFREIQPVLTTLETLMREHEAPLARALGAMLEIDRVADMHPEATIDPRSNIWDDVMDVARRMAQIPGLLEDVLAATADSRTARLGPIFANFARYRDRVAPVWTFEQQNLSLASRTLRNPVDRTRPDTQDLRGGPADNRSVLQRFAHLIHDLNGVRLCNRNGAYLWVRNRYRWPPPGNEYRECELIEIRDAAVFYLKVIDGSARITMRDSTVAGWAARNFGGSVDNMMEDESRITGFDTSPTPQAVNRFVFQPEALRTPFMRAMMDPVRTRDGLLARDVHPGTLFAAEMYGFYDALRPLVRAFVRNGTPSDPDAGAHLFVELLSALHIHYASPNAGQYQNRSRLGALYSTMDGAVRYEPIVIAALEGDLLPAATALTAALPGINAGGGRTGRDAFAAAARMLLDPNALTGLVYRDGRTSTVQSDGTTPVTRPNLYYLLADAMNGMDAAFSAAPAERESWAHARSRLVDTFLAVDNAGTPAARFRNRAVPVIGRLALAWLRDRHAAHQAVGDVDPWGRGLGRRLAETVSGPAFGAGLDLVLDLYNDVRARAATAGLLAHLLDDSGEGPDTPFGATLTAAADLLGALRAEADVVPLLHALAPSFQRRITATDPQGHPVALREENIPLSLRFLERARAYDTDRVLERVLANLVARPADSTMADEPLVIFGDAIAETHRLRPGAGGPLSGDDFAEVLRQVGDFFTDGSRGLEQFYYIVQHRRL